MITDVNSEGVMKAELSFSSEYLSISTENNEGKTVDIILDAKLYEVPAADVKIKFDPEYVEISSVEDGDFAGFTREEIDNENGYVSLSVTSNLEDMFTGEGTFAKLNVKVKQVGETKLGFTEGDSGIDTYLAAVGGDKIPVGYSELSVSINSEAPPEESTDPTRTELGLDSREGPREVE